MNSEHAEVLSHMKETIKAIIPSEVAALAAAIASLSANQPEGDVVVTRNEVGEIVAATRQDAEGRILSVIAEAADATAAKDAEIEALRRMVQERDNMLGRRPCAGVNADGKPRCFELVDARAGIEALRAEVTRLVGDAMQAQAEAKEFKGAGEVYKARAERLGEALRDARDSGGYVRDVARAALRDHDQEVGNG